MSGTESTPAFERLRKALRSLPGLGYRSAERIALHLAVERPEAVGLLQAALSDVARSVRRCARCGNLSEEDLCGLCRDGTRQTGVVCVVERIPDLAALERAAVFRGTYHVLHGRLSPMAGIGPEALNLEALDARVASGEIRELILALSNDIEGEATSHFLVRRLVGREGLRISRIGFGLPSGGGLGFADATTLRSALEGRRSVEGVS